STTHSPSQVPEGRTVTQIDRRRDLPLGEFLADYMRPRRPVIIEDATDDWPAMGKWTPDWFEQHHGDKELVVDGEPYRLEAFVERVRAGSDADPAPYLTNLEIPRKFPELWSDVLPYLKYAFPDRFKDAIVRRAGWPGLRDYVEFYLGGRGTRFATLHFDN